MAIESRFLFIIPPANNPELFHPYLKNLLNKEEWFFNNDPCVIFIFSPNNIDSITSNISDTNEDAENFLMGLTPNFGGFASTELWFWANNALDKFKEKDSE